MPLIFKGSNVGVKGAAVRRRPLNELLGILRLPLPAIVLFAQCKEDEEY